MTSSPEASQGCHGAADAGVHSNEASWSVERGDHHLSSRPPNRVGLAGPSTSGHAVRGVTEFRIFYGTRVVVRPLSCHHPTLSLRPSGTVFSDYVSANARGACRGLNFRGVICLGWSTTHWFPYLSLQITLHAWIIGRTGWSPKPVSALPVWPGRTTSSAELPRTAASAVRASPSRHSSYLTSNTAAGPWLTATQATLWVAGPIVDWLTPSTRNSRASASCSACRSL